MDALPLIHRPKTLLEISSYRPKFAGVGSRETPTDVLEVIRRVSHCLYDAGWFCMSGDADGADTAFHTGAMRSSRYPLTGFAAFLPWNGVEKKSTNMRRYENPELGLYDAAMFDNWESANAIASEARGGFHGLGRGGISLHTRNAYQVLSPTLRDPVQRVLFWAKPIYGGKVEGGTNTALQIALKHEIPTINLHDNRQRDTVERYLEQQGY